MVDSVQLRATDLAFHVGRSDLVKVGFIAIQLAVLLAAVWVFGIQGSAFRYTFALIIPGFAVHALLPVRYRAAFFLTLSLATAFLVLGIGNALWVIALGSGLIAICYLPVPFPARVGALAAIAGVFAFSRAGALDLPIPADIWPLLASLFMFRMIVYLYDTRHESERQPLTRTFAYFFMLPNVCFPLFPVIDYKRFCRAPRAGLDVFPVYQRGVQWMLRGVIHLLLYRFIYLNLALDPATATGLADALQFSFSAFLLYFQVSGTFHLIVGMLLLFGFDLPETHHRYLLASSFNDFWRRINIYWKDFMMKIFYYPVYFQVRRYGDVAAIVIATLVVFLGTWLLHAYQWFWLRGSLLIEWHDSLFWGVLALLVVGNSLYEHRFGRNRPRSGQAQSWWERASVSLSTAATFITIGLLWGMWSSDDIQQWTLMWATTDGGWRIFVVLVPCLYAVSLVLQHVGRRAAPIDAKVRPALGTRPVGFWKGATATMAGIVALAALGTVRSDSGLPEFAVSAVDDLRSARLNARGEGQLIRGYYEELVEVNRHMDGLWAIRSAKPPGWGKTSIQNANVPTDDIRVMEYGPDLEFTINGGLVTTNQWGMRDRDYTLQKAEGTIRIAVLGASYVFGLGVSDEEVFEALLEKRLNESANAAHHIELLNFAHTAKGPIRQARVLEAKIVRFAPDVLLVFGHRADANRSVVDIDLALEAGVSLGHPTLEALVREAGWTRSEADHLRRQRLARFRYELLDWAYDRMAAICREHGIRPVYVYLPFTGDGNMRSIPDDELASARSAGFTMLMDLQDVFAGHAPEAIRVAPWDGHPNQEGHRLLADRLYDMLNNRIDELARTRHQAANRVGATGERGL